MMLVVLVHESSNVTVLLQDLGFFYNFFIVDVN